MHAPIVRHTLTIFDSLGNPLPPLFPRAAAEDLSDTIRGFHAAKELSLPQLESTMIVWGKRLWPYRSAFAELLSAYEDRLGHRFMRAQLPETLADRYREFEAYGGEFRDIVFGPPQPFFDALGVGALRDAVLCAWQELRQHAVQGALSVDKDRYMERIDTHRNALREIDRAIDALEVFAEAESDECPALAAEIYAFVGGVNHGFCALGPAPTLHAVRHAHEHFLGRKKEKKEAR